MEITYLSIVLFIAITVIYYMVPQIGKKNITLDHYTAANGETIDDLKLANYIRLGIYFAVVVITQYVVNAIYIVNTCDGDVVTGLVNSFLFTFFPWVLIFGFMLVVLIMYPGFKSAFSDIVGYFVVASSVTETLNQIMIDPNVKKNIDDTNMSSEEKDKMRTVAQSVMKLVGNNAVFVNQITPDNFMETWKKIVPLMKDETTQYDKGLQQKLLDSVILRDTIGEGMWYLYTAIIIISTVAYKLSTMSCSQSLINVETDSLKRQKEIEKAVKKTSNTVQNVPKVAQNAPNVVQNTANSVKK